MLQLTTSHSDEHKVAIKGTVKMQQYDGGGKWHRPALLQKKKNGTDQQVDAVGPIYGYNITIVVF
ncbi:hypothetical protein MTR_5g069690 [Medicago truncatula]|uniref:Uncharacterized protein n=1 Tax=Medicago truncatula TaxID=3880 RepID=G7KE43_MEDTR|nr:hypothetical protein MTR_5g069690 [Medicago truncatula]